MHRSSSAATAGLTSAFDPVIERRGTNSMKWDGGPEQLSPEQTAADPLPMWVADMDFRAPQPVVDALQEAVEFGVFGYPAGLSAGFLDAVVSWQARRFGWEVERDWVLPSAGIITGLKTVVQTVSRPGDSVLIQPPVYGHFHEDMLMNGRRLAYAPLVREGDRYRFDPSVFEAAIRPDTTVFILSNPHNPTGNVWTEDELRTMGEICARHGVLVVSDEVHQDLVLNPECRHVPFASLGAEFAQNSVTCVAPSKTFNLAGLQTAVMLVPDARLRAAVARTYERNTFPLLNGLGMVAAEAAYTHGEPWLTDLLDHLRGNHARFAEGVAGLGAGLHVLPADALYLAWMDCTGLGFGTDEAGAEALDDFMLTQARLWFDRGPKFGAEGYGCMRVNLGCPRATVDEALARLTGALSREAGGGSARAGESRRR
ncbi:MalY/PatB family protein [Brevibacterium album]|uniref:MalY/PatB family protein n=1 Tax=Brevibacterium album TaxID=417948 RepID=UPI000408AF42|nr:MalY/PatB family protein [Brevibacterium album]